MNKLIGISGLAGDGKDSLCNMLRDLFEEMGYEFERIALADSIKEECKEALLSLYGIDPIICSREDKSKIRDFLVFHGKVKRIETRGAHWTNKISKTISELAKTKNDRIICVPDIRHAEYENDEVYWLKKNGGILIHVKKYSIESASPFKKTFSIPVNNQEATHTPKVEALADYVLEWQDTSPKPPEESHFSKQSVYELFSLIYGALSETKSSSKSRKNKKNIENLSQI